MLAAGSFPTALRILGEAAMVMSATALLLRGADRFPGWALGHPPGVLEYRSIAALEGRLGQELALPRALPEGIETKPVSVRWARGEPAAVAFVYRDRTTGSVRLLVLQTLGGDGPFPASLLPPGAVFHSLTVPVSGHAAVLSAVSVPDSGVWQELSWRSGQRRLLLRFRGPTLVLLRVAEGLEGGRG